MVLNLDWTLKTPKNFLKNGHVQALHQEILIYLAQNGAILGIVHKRASTTNKQTS